MEADTIKTSQGDLVISFLGHGSLMMTYVGKTIHIDPVSSEADYAKLPKADIIFITHEHYDHLDLKAVNSIKTAATKIVGTSEVASQIPGIVVMKNGNRQTVDGLQIEAVPAYNIVNMQAPGKPFHPKGVGNGYIVTFGDKRLYIAGDTENTSEMKKLRNIDIAFLPMNLPYTMTPEMVADAAKEFKPTILYPYHYGETDTAKLVALLKDEKGIEVRIRKMQ
ncbi:MAG: putative Zn-dependent hydrolase of beta-lactamase fold protein [Syntrophaceae bacterium]|nr:MAG: putative Zn-dependent hydrolase of beta-lactamase fold protein [Syntrophaceae bacterium]